MFIYKVTFALRLLLSSKKLDKDKESKKIFVVVKGDY